VAQPTLEEAAQRQSIPGCELFQPRRTRSLGRGIVQCKSPTLLENDDSRPGRGRDAMSQGPTLRHKRGLVRFSASHWRDLVSCESYYSWARIASVCGTSVPEREQVALEPLTPTDCVSAADTGKPLFLLEQVTPSPSCVHFRCISGLGISRHPRNPSCARAVLSMSHSEANDAPFGVVLSAPSLASRNANADEKIRLSHRAETRRCVMRFGADRCKALHHRTGASGSLRVRQSGPGDFIRCERRHTDPMGACS
jgi:hypothetical protein